MFWFCSIHVLNQRKTPLSNILRRLRTYTSIFLLCLYYWSRRTCWHVDEGTFPHQVLAVTLTLSQSGGGGRLCPPYSSIHTKFWKPQARLWSYRLTGNDNRKSPWGKTCWFCIVLLNWGQPLPANEGLQGWTCLGVIFEHKPDILDPKRLEFTAPLSMKLAVKFLTNWIF